MKKEVARDKIEIVVADAQQAADVARSLRWSWPQTLVFGPYRSFRREGFVGRSWLFEEVRTWAMAEGAAAGRPRAQLIEAEYGVGKSAFLAELVDTQAAGVPGRFVSSIAAQLAAALPAYRAAIEAEAAAGLRQLLEAPDNDPIGAFDQAVLAPLEAIAPRLRLKRQHHPAVGPKPTRGRAPSAVCGRCRHHRPDCTPLPPPADRRRLNRPPALVAVA